jgi:pyruvate/2-oxoglutarate dehydrogenase complex dihydrolipoamide dehydrogenase (E3) component
LNGENKTISGSHLLVATGRRANVKDLNLEAVNIKYTDKGIQVDERLRTTNRQVYAIGDVIGGYQFTHVANYHAGIVIRNLLFRIPTKVNYRTLPWVTFTQPELAHVGLTEIEAKKRYQKVKVVSCSFAENDRAQTGHETLGQIKVTTDHKDHIIGVSILGPHAGELLTPWILAMQKKKKIRAMTEIIIPYPTLSEINKTVANNFYKDLLFSSRVKRLVRFLKL